MSDPESAMPGAPRANEASAIVVTHDSDHCIGPVLRAVLQAGVPASNLCVVDSGSTGTKLLERLQRELGFRLSLSAKNVGFCRGNNIGYEILKTAGCLGDYVMLVNPDLLLPPQWAREAAKFLEDPANASVGIVGGPLFGYDFETGKPTGLVDSLGIYRSWGGRWYDKAHRERRDSIVFPRAPYRPAAICGALMAFRRSLADEIVARRGQLLLERLYMYKEDIEVCLFAKRLGWRIAIDPALEAFHQRGWSGSRRNVAYWKRWYSARNEAIIAIRYPTWRLPSYALKFLYVHIVEPLVDELLRVMKQEARAPASPDPRHGSSGQGGTLP